MSLSTSASTSSASASASTSTTELKDSKLRLGHLKSFLSCPICEGYLIDATTITDCPHSFCRSCILSYIEKHEDRDGNCLCPECPKNPLNPVETPIRAEARHLILQADTQLQDLVYKLVPGLYKEELRRRGAFYTKKGVQGAGKWERHLSSLFIFTPEEAISFSLQSGFPPPTNLGTPLSSSTSPGPLLQSPPPSTSSTASSTPLSNGGRRKKGSTKLSPDQLKLRELRFKRYFRCQAKVRMGQLKKLLKYKLELPSKYAIHVFHSEAEPLKDSLSLMDLAYIYSWQRKSPIQLYFNIIRPEQEESLEPPPLLLPQLNEEGQKASLTPTSTPSPIPTPSSLPPPQLPPTSMAGESGPEKKKKSGAGATSEPGPAEPPPPPTRKKPRKAANGQRNGEPRPVQDPKSLSVAAAADHILRNAMRAQSNHSNSPTTVTDGTQGAPPQLPPSQPSAQPPVLAAGQDQAQLLSSSVPPRLELGPEKASISGPAPAPMAFSLPMASTASTLAPPFLPPPSSAPLAMQKVSGGGPQPQPPPPQSLVSVAGLRFPFGNSLNSPGQITGIPTVLYNSNHEGSRGVEGLLVFRNAQ